MSSARRVAAVAGIAAVVIASATPAVANADNSNNNTNNNDVTNIGDPSDEWNRPNQNTNWPPAGLSWPPNDVMNSSGENGGTAATPIVMPMGERAPREAATPIVPVNAPQ
jgi:hypothetical protein